MKRRLLQDEARPLAEGLVRDITRARALARWEDHRRRFFLIVPPALAELVQRAAEGDPIACAALLRLTQDGRQDGPN